MTRRPLIAANWKMHKTNQEAKDFMKDLLPLIADLKDVDVLICPPFTAISTVDQCRQDSKVLLGAQNMYFEEKGAFTGEVAPGMLKEINCEFVILGHSERRWIFGENDELINKKVISAFEHDLIPVLCVGEKLEERESGQTEQVILKQLENDLKGVSEDHLKNMVIAYEPVWAIGTGKTATPDDAQAIHKFIRAYIAKLYNQKVADEVIIQYGGSMKASNAPELLAQPDIDGGLIGGASLKAETFVPICVL